MNEDSKRNNVSGVNDDVLEIFMQSILHSYIFDWSSIIRNFFI